MMLNILQYTNYRELLKDILTERKECKEDYSMRFFANEIGISPSFLSRLLNGKKKLSLEKAGLIAECLKLDNSEKEHFSLLIQLENQESENNEHNFKNKILNSQILKSDNFKLISDWYHFAIIALTKLNNFKATSKWISKALGISELDARIAISRLKKLGLLKISSGKLVENPNTNITTEDDIYCHAIQNNHAQNIKKGLVALIEQSPEEREFSNCTVVINKKNFLKIQKRIRNLIIKLNDEIDCESGDELYQLNLQFFKLTKD